MPNLITAVVLSHGLAPIVTRTASSGANVRKSRVDRQTRTCPDPGMRSATASPDLFLRSSRVSESERGNYGRFAASSLTGRTHRLFARLGPRTCSSAGAEVR